MESSIQALKVINRSTKQPFVIKLENFNPDLHEKIEGEKPFVHHYSNRVAPNEKIIVNSTLAAAEKLAEVVKKAEEQKVIPSEDETKSEAVEPKSVDSSLFVGMKFFEIRRYAKEKGVAITPSMTKAEIIAELEKLEVK